jgi:hypothetical protein
MNNATASGQTTLWWGGNNINPLVGFQSVPGWEARFRILIPTGFSSPTEAGVSYYFGLGDVANGTATLPSNGFFFKLATGGSSPWSMEALKAGASEAGAPKSSTAGNVTAGTWYTGRIRSVNAGEILMSINAGSGFEAEKVLNVTSTANLTPFFAVQATAGATSQRRMYIDYFRLVAPVTRY